MHTPMNLLRKKEDKVDPEQENTHGVYEVMKAVLEKKVQLYEQDL
jgi:hypothetical protein